MIRRNNSNTRKYLIFKSHHNAWVIAGPFNPYRTDLEMPCSMEYFPTFNDALTRVIEFISFRKRNSQ